MSIEDEQDTLPLDFSGLLDGASPKEKQEPTLSLGWDVNGDGEITGIEEKVPEPAILRAALFAAANVIGLFAGHEFLDPDALEKVIAAYSVIGPLILGYWIRRGTVPVAK